MSETELHLILLSIAVSFSVNIAAMIIGYVRLRVSFEHRLTALETHVMFFMRELVRQQRQEGNE